MIIVKGDLFKQQVECFVNPWNMNYLPWFILLPHGVSGSLKRIGGYKPFNELLAKGILKPGQAVMTSGGRLNQRIIHVAGLTWYWTSNIKIVEKCVFNALTLGQKNNIKSIAIPLIGTGVGGLKTNDVLEVMRKVIASKDWSMKIVVVEYEN